MKIPDHSKYKTILEFNKLAAENVAQRLAQATLVSKSHIANFVKKTDFDDKQKNLNKNVTPNKTKHVLVGNELDEPSRKVEAISTIGLTTDLINGYKILNAAKYFSSGIFQNYLVFIPAKNTLNILVALLEFIHENLIESQKKILKIQLQSWS